MSHKSVKIHTECRFDWTSVCYDFKWKLSKGTKGLVCISWYSLTYPISVQRLKNMQACLKYTFSLKRQHPWLHCWWNFDTNNVCSLPFSGQNSNNPVRLY